MDAYVTVCPSSGVKIGSRLGSPRVLMGPCPVPYRAFWKPAGATFPVVLTGFRVFSRNQRIPVDWGDGTSELLVSDPSARQRTPQPQPIKNFYCPTAGITLD